ncbi:MAG TPA: choice-of-anchor D domain-containing protein, partial [Candidatus Kapabacteria bacterium]|nr:choice-of-anchor D domain-containing protein [Candidatus Kapabacteria bacterium]
LHITGTINQLDTTLAFDTVIDINATATPVPPELASADSSINFGALTKCTGVVARDTSILFTNTGCAPDTITGLTLTGVGFSGGNDSLPIVVPSGDSVTLEYHFVPPDSGAFSGTVKLHVTSMGLTEDPMITLTGTGIQGLGVLDVRSTSLQAGSFSFCDGDTTLTDTLRNTGCDTLVLSNLRFAGDSAFSLLSQLDSLLLPGGSEIIQFYFAPRVKGAHTASLSFHSQNIVNDKGHDTTVTISGFGLGGNTVLSANTTTRNFGSLYECEARDTTIWLYNPGCDTLRIVSATVSNSDFVIDTSFPQIIPKGDSVSVRVTLIPQNPNNPIHPGSDNGAVTFYSDANTGPGTETVPLRAALIPPAQLTLSLSPAQSAKSGQAVTFYVILAGDSGRDGRSTPLTGIQFDLTHNDDLLSFQSASGVTRVNHPLPRPWKGGGITDTFVASPLLFKEGAGGGLDTIGSLAFQVYLTDSNETPLTISNISFQNSLGLPNDCIASFGDSGSGFTYNYQCGEHLIQDAMRGVPFTIESIVPNPATNSITVTVVGAMPSLELDDVL